MMPFVSHHALELTINVDHLIPVHRAPRQFDQLAAAVLLFLILFAAMHLRNTRQRLAGSTGRIVSRTLLSIIRPGIAYLAQFAVEHFHKTMRIGVIVNGRSVALAPAQNH